MQAGDGITVLVVECADHDPVGVEEVLDRCALGRELGVRGVADLAQPPLVEAVAHLEARAHRNRALHDDDAAPVDGRQLVDHCPHRGEIGVAGVGGRRADGDVDEVGAVDRLADVGGKAKALAVSRDQLLEARLVDRHLAALQGRDALRDHVPDDDRVAELGEAGTGDEADVAGTEDGDVGRGGAHDGWERTRPPSRGAVVTVMKWEPC